MNDSVIFFKCGRFGKVAYTVTGKSEKPHIKDVKSLPCVYKSNRSSWMTCKFFPTHPKNFSTLKNVHVEFLPANSTSVLHHSTRAQSELDSLSQETIVNCFGKVGFGTVSEELSVVSLDTVEESDSIWAEVKERLGEIENLRKYSENASMEEHGQPCDANENVSEHEDAPKPVTCSEATPHLEAYSCYLSSVPDVPENIMKNLWEN
ncbi:hypothetical protein PR048_001705 [Dryococelus australis]|uniref:DDE-1 domain-containing protein n=1 Tax=Dryococelus australis TaxID=614101 RepID=A0ABQ9IJ60_9NEOP|nr:hypothetical protein PR048_001705 [Dryococelus australis]